MQIKERNTERDKYIFMDERRTVIMKKVLIGIEL